MGAWFAAGKNWRIKRFYCNNFNIRVPLFEYLSNTGNGSAGTYAADKNVNVSIGIVPNLFGGRLTMDLRICKIFKLLRNK